ncbi:MAG: 1-acyl-sn-glycerol-3-phosphate acyltransferase [Clostridia bacterium]|nr:1-acyl-sn-glycerol-3-phosphate acyltransferase [Clostridia bacterium]
MSKKKWIKKRHGIIRAIAAATLGIYVRLWYGVKVEKFREQGKRPYLIVMNHTTFCDQFLVGMAFRGPVYYIASEDLFSNGWISRLLTWAVAPIPIKKQTVDVHAVANCIRVAREGGTIALAPEGNRTYCGKTAYIKPSIVKLIRKLHLPLAVFRIEGGYGVHPRWSDVVRKGPMRAYVSRVVETEEYSGMSDEELFALLQREMNVNEAQADGAYEHPQNAEFLERLLYVCPKCGLSEFESREDRIRCKNCGLTVRHKPTKELEGVGETIPFRFVADWYDYQCDFVNQLDPNAFLKIPMYTDTVRLSEVVLYQKKNILLKETELQLFGDRLTVGETAVPFTAVTGITVQGKNKLVVYWDGKVWQMKGGKRFNAIKYMNMAYRYKNVNEGDGNGKFLGF